MLLLDSEALSALAHGPPSRRRQVVNHLAVARRSEVPIGTSAATLAEVIRGHPRDAAVYATLSRETVGVRAVTPAIGVAAGRLLGALGAGSELAVDAFLVATGAEQPSARILTTDPRDLTALADQVTDVDVVTLP